MESWLRSVLPGVDPDALEILGTNKALMAAIFTSYRTDRSYETLMDNGELLRNPDWSPVVDLSRLDRKTLNISNDIGEKRDLTVYWTSGKDEDYEAVWPARTKTDLAIRRTRARDLWLHLRGKTKYGYVKRWIDDLRGDFDYISVLILGWAAVLFGEEWCNTWSRLGACDNGIERWALVTKKVNDLLKLHGIQDDQFNYVECAALLGYRNPPYPGFDVFREAEILASGGGERTFLPGMTFKDYAVKALRMDVPAVKYVSFTSYVEGVELDPKSLGFINPAVRTTGPRWLTTGASSEGYLEFVDMEGKTHRIKARKNFIPDVIPLSTLAEEAATNEQQVNKTIIKAELGKIRLAVSSDLNTYLQMSWVLHHLGGAYKQWLGNTLEETIEEQTRRLLHMLDLCRDKYGLPFDYAGFDHQPNTDELVCIMKILIEHARRNIEPCGLAEFDAIGNRVLAGFTNSTLEARRDSETRLYKVTGGLMSGLRVTSVIGNAWNSVLTAAVIDLCTAAGMNPNGIARYIRGDDSAIFTDTPAQATVLSQGYKVSGALSTSGKFSVQHGKMEFLRVWFDTRCHGYPARAIAGLVQRKPWSSEPWSADSTLKAIREVVNTLNRRGLQCEAVWSTISGHWCNLHRLPKAVLQVPRSLGGFGLVPWDGFTILSEHVPKMPKTSFTFTNVTPWRRTQIQNLAREHNIPLSLEQIDKIATDQLLGVVASDDVPMISRDLRTKWRDQLKAMHIRPKRTTRCFDPIDKLITLPTPRSYEASQTDLTCLLTDLENQRGSFGSRRKDGAILSAIKPLLAEAGLSLRQWIRQNLLHLNDAMTRLGSSHIAEKLDWLLGDIPAPTEKLHPACSSWLKDTLAGWVKPKVKVPNASLSGFFSVYARSAENLILSWPLVQSVYMW